MSCDLVGECGVSASVFNKERTQRVENKASVPTYAPLVITDYPIPLPKLLDFKQTRLKQSMGDNSAVNIFLIIFLIFTYGKSKRIVPLKFKLTNIFIHWNYLLAFVTLGTLTL